MRPITSHPSNLAQFVHPRPKIMAVQTRMPKIDTTGTEGTLNCLGISGCFTLIIHTPAQTRMNANKVPILVISPTTSAGMNPANKADITKNIMLDLYGVLNFGCTSEKTFGTKPSRLIEKNTRD